MWCIVFCNTNCKTNTHKTIGISLYHFLVHISSLFLLQNSIMAGFSYLLCLVCSIPVGVWLLLDIQKSDGTSSEKSSWTTTMYCFTLRKILKINFTKPWACPFKWHWVTLRLLEPYTTPSGLFENFTWVSKVILQSIFELIRNLGKIPLLHITSVPIPFSWGLTHWLFLRNKNLLCLVGNKPCT